ncbi:hypothetical protein [Fontivita pretiosa]|uniref:hypothetical protein n=1 Tax=Fontivita pretiosa TaxID=2989684 RepID=UPI003D17167E
MRRATSVYILMLLAFAVGLWAILSFGSLLLRAPTDLAGLWHVYSPGDEQSGADPLHVVRIDQSGRYFHINFDGQRMSLKQAGEQIDAARIGPDLVTIRLVNGQTELMFVGAADAEVYTLSARGRWNGTWRVVRVERPHSRRSRDRTGPRTTPAVHTISPRTNPTIQIDARL